MSTPQPELAAWLRLSLAPGVGSSAQRRLLAVFGLPEAVFAAGHRAVAAVVGSDVADSLLAAPDPAALETALAWTQQPGNHILTLADAVYPQSLLDTADPPILLYAKGDLTLLRRPALAVVGARSATAQGTDNARAFARALAEAGLAIVSGLALGIDAAAHQGALDAQGGATIAVIGTGADRIYPARNQALAHAIAERGLMLSEFPLGTPPRPHNFPRRNRLIAGLARGVLVVEAALGSGSLITARLAADSGREVFAIPGSIHSPLSRGCHRLIRDGAKLVEMATDILEELQLDGSAMARPTEPPAVTAPAADDDPAAALLANLGHDPVDLDTLAARSGLTVDALYAILLPMELDGRIARLPGGRFQRR